MSSSKAPTTNPSANTAAYTKVQAQPGRALVLAPFSREALNALELLLPVTYESWTETQRLYEPEELVDRLDREDVEVLVVEADFIFEEVFQGVNRLKLLGVCRGTLNQVDLEAATRHGVAVVNTPARNAQAVAELTLGLMLALARGIPVSHRYVSSGHWQNPVEPYISMRGVELQGKTLGVIGLGAVGTLVARLGRSLGMDVLAYDPLLGPLGRKRRGALLTSLERLLQEADFLSIHAPLTSATEGLLNRESLSRMKRNSYIINTAAFEIVDEESLVELLKDGQIAGAALDVHEAHPIPPSSPLLGLPNVILTPHIGGATHETVERHSWMMVEDVRRFLEGRRPRHLVNSQVWKHRG